MEFDRNEVLARSPEQLKRDKAAQEAARARLSPAVVENVATLNYQNAVATEKNLSDDVSASLDRFAEALFWQGRFSEAVLAADAAGNDVKALEYGEFMVAMSNFGDTCGCGPVRLASATAKGASWPNLREIQEVYVADQRRLVKFYRCDVCGGLFARNLK